MINWKSALGTYKVKARYRRGIPDASPCTYQTPWSLVPSLGQARAGAACLPVVAAAVAAGLGKLHDEIRRPLPSVARQLRCSTIGWDCPQVSHHIEVCGSMPQIPPCREYRTGAAAPTG